MQTLNNIETAAQTNFQTLQDSNNNMQGGNPDQNSGGIPANFDLSILNHKEAMLAYLRENERKMKLFKNKMISVKISRNVSPLGVRNNDTQRRSTSTICDENLKCDIEDL